MNNHRPLSVGKSVLLRRKYIQYIFINPKTHRIVTLGERVGSPPSSNIFMVFWQPCRSFPYAFFYFRAKFSHSLNCNLDEKSLTPRPSSNTNIVFVIRFLNRLHSKGFCFKEHSSCELEGTFTFDNYKDLVKFLHQKLQNRLGSCICAVTLRYATWHFLNGSKTLGTDHSFHCKFC